MSRLQHQSIHRASAVIVRHVGGPEVLEQTELPLGPVSRGELLVQIAAAAVTPLDTYLRAGLQFGSYRPTLPYVPGSAFAGSVIEAGSDVNLREGQRIFGNAKTGAYAGMALCDADRVYPLPDDIRPTAGAWIPVPYRTAWWSLVDLAYASDGETVLVQGAAGSVGAAAVQIARARGLHVIATCSPDAAAQVSEDGANAVVDFRSTEWTDHVRQVADGRVINIVIEVAARANLAADMEIVGVGGRIVVVGGHGETRIDPLPIIAKGLAIHGVSLPNIPPHRDAQIMAAIVAGLERGTFRPRVALTFPFHDVIAAHKAIEAGRGSGGVALVMEE